MCSIEEQAKLLGDISVHVKKNNEKSALPKILLKSGYEGTTLSRVSLKNEPSETLKCKSLDDISSSKIKISRHSSSCSKSWKCLNQLDQTITSKNNFEEDDHEISIKPSDFCQTTYVGMAGNGIISRSTPVISYTFTMDAKICESSGNSVHRNTIKPLNNVFQPIRNACVSYETSQSSESVICRICHSAGDDRLIAPCRCDGSTRYVHATCLVTWFKKSVKNQCELCRSDVKIRKINHRISLWRKPEDRPVPIIWFSVFLIGLFLNILSIYVNASESCASTACLIFYVVNGFGIVLDAAFLWFWFLKCKHYWKKWCALNQDWYIDDLTDEEMALSVEYVRNQEDEAFV